MTLLAAKAGGGGRALRARRCRQDGAAHRSAAQAPAKAPAKTAAKAAAKPAAKPAARKPARQEAARAQAGRRDAQAHLTAPSRYAALDGLRGFAVLLVFFVHAAGNSAAVAFDVDFERMRLRGARQRG